jgi:hypothetical protein
MGSACAASVCTVSPLDQEEAREERMLRVNVYDADCNNQLFRLELAIRWRSAAENARVRRFAQRRHVVRFAR